MPRCRRRPRQSRTESGTTDGAAPGAHSRFVAEAGLCLALAATLKLARVFSLPAGGSVTLASSAPLWLFARRHGVWRGALLGGAFGLLDLVLHPWVTHWAQALLDYPIAFATSGLAGVSWLPLWLGCLAAATMRFGFHVLAGAVFFASSAPKGMPVLTYSAIYNAYVFPDAILALVVLEAVLARLPRLALRDAP